MVANDCESELNGGGFGAYADRQNNFREWMMAGDGNGAGAAKIGPYIKDSTPFWPAPARAPKGAPNILVVLFDDVGFSDFGCYGSPIATPTIDAIAARGVRYAS